MVKFSKELEAQLIPEWKEAFVNYWQLKKHVKKIKLSRKPTKTPHPHALIRWGLACSILLDPVRSAAEKFADRFRGSDNDKNSVAQVTSDNVENGQVEDEAYETELTKLFNEEHEVRAFCEAVEEELNKVNRFYESREKEFLDRGEELNKQLQTLQELKSIPSESRRRNSLSLKANSNREGSLSGSWPSSHRDHDLSSESFGEPLNKSSMEEALEEGHGVATLETNGVSYVSSVTRSSSKSKLRGKPRMGMAKKRIPSTATPAGAFAALTSMLQDDLADSKSTGKDGAGDSGTGKKKIQCAEKMIRGAFVELYRGLCLLKNYSSLNLMAFTKILKKFHKVAGPQASTNYLKEVKKSHFVSSDKVIRLMDEVESMFTEQFTNNDRKKAMKFLRPQKQRDSHMVTFFVGLLTGCFVTLFSLYAILAHLTGISSYPYYVEIVYPLFSVFALFSLHLFMYGCNLFMWKRTRINYNFICEFSPTTALKYRDAFLICIASMMTVVGAMVIHLLLLTNGFPLSRVNAIPGVLLLIYILLLVCPFCVFYRPTRYCFIRVIRNIICSPFVKVLMVDFFMADQLTSQIPLLRHMESTACYFLAGSFGTHQYRTGKSGRFYGELAYVISFLPYYWRAMQCVRRWFDEGDVNHLANMGKYVSAMAAAGARIVYAHQERMLWLVVVLVTSTAAVFYQLYWDFIKDWGVLNRRSKNPWLRDDLILKNKCIYFISIALNIVLRFAWVETVLRFRVGVVESRLLDLFMASLEVIRRGHWNFYRLENEHLNNVGRFRAVKTVPLPFRETDSDD
ncbi:phosphate transporter PHO1-like [Rhodamnia argentea]|uniref:Phosphate transporter PHO1-like n=1 Tax=Rhodamnia argentea TaxID=178133 RepID=A0ABM3GXV2_9MYRT|nr:phosphate transporter PHO1-like [Rhodamnia argentea]